MTTQYREAMTPAVEPHLRVSIWHKEDAWLTMLALTDRYSFWRLLYSQWIKRWFDCVAALVSLVLLAPLMLVIYIAIRLESRGPAVFRQMRIGKGGKPFTMYKFRTMIPDRRKNRSASYTGTERRRSHKTRNDPRVTWLGRLLRRTSLDELPQLINILLGDMSFVGPRPELPEIVDRYEPWQHQRHLVTPGLTGWWQIKGRSERPMHENTELDIYYVTHISPWLDIVILLRTVRSIFSGHGAF